MFDGSRCHHSWKVIRQWLPLVNWCPRVENQQPIQLNLWTHLNHGINSTVEISWDIFFRILADYRLRHFVNNVAIHIYTHDYIRMEITVLYLKISRQVCSPRRRVIQFKTISYLGDNCIVFENVTASIGDLITQIEFTGDAIWDHEIDNWCREIFKYI
jgi:hypothetical protein